MGKQQAPSLLWNERGQIGCTIPGHAPQKGTDTWKFEHWKKVPAGTTKEDGTELRCEMCAVQEHREEEAAKDGVPAPTPQQEAEEPKAAKKQKEKRVLSLADLSDKYLAHLEKDGHSAGTIASYGLELRTAMGELGAGTLIAGLTMKQIRAYFDCAKVTKKKSGKHKSPLSIAKTRRVLRLALVWAEEKKLIEKAPVPAETAKA